MCIHNTYIYVDVVTHTHTYKQTYIHVYVCVYIYVSMYGAPIYSSGSTLQC